MTIHCSRLLCLLPLASAAWGADPDPATIALLTRQAHAWDQAIVRKDRAAVADNMATEFRDIDGHGTSRTGRRSSRTSWRRT